MQLVQEWEAALDCLFEGGEGSFCLCLCIFACACICACTGTVVPRPDSQLALARLGEFLSRSSCSYRIQSLPESSNCTYQYINTAFSLSLFPFLSLRERRGLKKDIHTRNHPRDIPINRHSQLLIPPHLQPVAHRHE